VTPQTAYCDTCRALRPIQRSTHAEALRGPRDGVPVSYVRVHLDCGHTRRIAMSPDNLHRLRRSA
jgi:hypothetical protein